MQLPVKQTYDNYDDFRANYKINIPEGFNFSFDVIDRIAGEEEKGKTISFHIGKLKRVRRAHHAFPQAVGFRIIDEFGLE